MDGRLYSNDVFLEDKVISKTIDEIFRAIKEQLPKEYHNICIVKDILSEAEKKLNFKEIVL